MSLSQPRIRLRKRRRMATFTGVLSVLCKNPSVAFVPPSQLSRSFRSTATSLFVTHTTQSQKLIHLHSIPKEELQLVVESWGYPKYRADQIWTWIRQGVVNVDEMSNIPKALRSTLKEFSSMSSLTLDTELVSKDGTMKRAYRLPDDQLIESVLMPYEDGRYTACISSQAGCAMACVFCATGQSGFARQLTAGEIFEQVSKFASELNARNERLSNIVFMGMGEPLANYNNVKKAVQRITTDLGIGARKITISTVGVVPNIRKLMSDPEMPQVRLAVSLHCASEEERTALIPANARYGGLQELMTTLREYIDTTGRRITLEWALIDGENDSLQSARRLGELIKTYQLRRDMVHVNVIPLNPTGGYAASPSGRARVNAFIEVLEKEYGISTTPRVRRGIDIDAGCGQLKTTIEKKEAKKKSLEEEGNDGVVIEKDFHEFLEEAAAEQERLNTAPRQIVDFSLDEAAVDFESDDYIDPVFEDEDQEQEAARLIALVQDSFAAPTPQAETTTTTTSIADEEAVRKAKKRRKKLLKNLKAIRKLQELESSGRELNDEQRAKIARQDEWQAELDSVQHNLQ